MGGKDLGNTPPPAIEHRSKWSHRARRIPPRTANLQGMAWPAQ